MESVKIDVGWKTWVKEAQSEVWELLDKSASERKKKENIGKITFSLSIIVHLSISESQKVNRNLPFDRVD